ncbi:hypothetical protein RCL1_003767 [Eukaryota sp. TZLM3-RCL]
MPQSFVSVLTNTASSLHISVPEHLLQRIDASGDVLDLSGTTLRPPLIRTLAEALCSDSTFSAVSLADCYLDDQTVAEFIKGLSHCRFVTHLNLRGNSVSSLSCQAFADFFRTNQTIQSLNLEWNKLGFSASNFSKFCEGLIDNHSLTFLDLRNNSINPDTINHFSRVLSSNRTLTSVDFRYNSIGDEGAHSILSAIEHDNHVISDLQLSVNHISEELISKVNQLLERNRGLLAGISEKHLQSNLIDIEKEATSRHLESKYGSRVRSIEDDNQRLVEVNKNLLEKISTLNLEVGSTTSRAESAEDQLSRLQGQNFDLSTEVATLRQSLEECRSKSTQSLDSFMKSQRNFELQLNEQKSINSSLENELISLKNEISVISEEHRAKIEVKNKEIEKLRVKNETTLNEKNDELSSIRNEMSSLVETCQSNVENLEKLRQEAENALRRALEEKNLIEKSKRKELAKLKSELELNFDQKIIEEKSISARLSHELMELKHDHAGLQKKLILREAELNEQLTRVSSKINDCERKLIKFETDNETLKTLNTSLTSKITNQSQIIEDLKIQISNLQSNLDQQVRNTDDLRTSKTEEIRQKDALISELKNRLTNERENSERRLKNLEEILTLNIRRVFSERQSPDLGSSSFS